jgi:hypothetical protein
LCGSVRARRPWNVSAASHASAGVAAIVYRRADQMGAVERRLASVSAAAPSAACTSPSATPSTTPARSSTPAPKPPNRATSPREANASRETVATYAISQSASHAALAAPSTAPPDNARRRRFRRSSKRESHTLPGGVRQ